MFVRRGEMLVVCTLLAGACGAREAGGFRNSWECEGGVWTNVVPETWPNPPTYQSHPDPYPKPHFPDCGAPVTVGVSKVGGTPQFTVNGKPVYALWGTVRCDRLVRHSSAPLNFITIWNQSGRFWPRGMEFDPSSLDFNAERHLRMYPDALILWDITIYPPKDWGRTHPDDLALDEQGNFNCDPDMGCSNYSFASENALRDMEMMVEKIIRYLESSPYANRIAGYRINSGHTAEWLGWHCGRKNTVLDFSPVACERFADFVAQNYPQLKDRTVPKLAERTDLDAPQSVVWDRQKHLKTIAYHEFYSQLMADAAVRLCRKGRELVGRKKLIGTYFGYMMTLNEGGSQQMLAHYATKRFLDRAEGIVDFVMSPPGYSFGQRGLGDTLADMKPFASIQDHGMVSVVEDDFRTHMNPCGTSYQAALTEWQSVQVMRRDMGIAICRNMPFYTFAITSGSDFDFPQFGFDAAKLRRAGEWALRRQVRRKSEIAYVVSEKSILSMPMMSSAKYEIYPAGIQTYNPDGTVSRIGELSGSPFCGYVYGKIGNELARIGTPVDYRLAEDLEDNVGDYKLYVFSGCLAYDPALAKVAARLRERDCTIVWAYAPGAMTDGADVRADMRRLTGLDLVPVETAMDCEIVCEKGFRFGKVGHPVSPLFKVTNPQKVLGTYANGDAGLALTKTGKATSVFCGAYRLERPFLRAMARLANVRFFVDSDDPMEANEAFVSLHARTGGRKTVRLPRRTDIADVFAGKVVARQIEEFSFEAPLNSSWLFYYGDDAAAFVEK